MNKNAEINVGMLIVMFVGVIVALALLTPAITGNVSDVVNTIDFNTTSGDASITPDGSIQNLAGRSVASFTAVNASSGTTIESGNWTILNNQIVSGELTATINASVDSGDSEAIWNVTYTFQPTGYIPDAGGRAITSLIIIFSAIAILMFVITQVMGDKLLDMFR